MRPGWLILTATLLVGIAVPLIALSESPQDEPAPKRKPVRTRPTPDHYQRLRPAWHTFQALPPERQALIRRLDSELHQDDPESRALCGVLNRYVIWLEKLEPADRQRVEDAKKAGQQQHLR